jgi:thioesterase domain-containing protein
MANKIKIDMGMQLSLTSLIEARSIEKMANIMREQSYTLSYNPIVEIQRGDSRPPLFCIHAGGGSVLCFIDLARYLGPDIPVYGLQARGQHHGQTPFTTVEEMATCYLEAIRSVQPHGPYYLAGLSFGGLVAFEIAQQLYATGEQVGLLAMLDAGVRVEEGITEFDSAEILATMSKTLAPVSVDELRQLEQDEQLVHVFDEAKRNKMLPEVFGLEEARRYFNIFKANSIAQQHYSPRPYPGHVALFRASEMPEEAIRFNATKGWDKWALGGVSITVVPGTHSNIYRKPNVQSLAERLRESLDRAQTAAL